MVLSTRVFALALCISSAAWAQSPDARTSHQQAKPEAIPNASDRSADPPFPLLPWLIEQSDAETNADRVRQAKQDSRDEENLVIQKQLVQIAQSTFSLAIWQLILGVFGALGLLITLVLTRRSIRAAELATDTTREMMYRQLRAYVLLEHATIIAKDGTHLGIDLMFRNGGQTPAVNMIVHASFQTVIVGTQQIPIIPKHQYPPFSVLPGAGRSKLLGWITTDHAAELDAGICQIDVIGFATYEDTFGKRHTAHFRFEGGGIHGFKPGMELTAQSVGNFEHDE